LNQKIKEQQLFFDTLANRLADAIWSRLLFQDSLHYQFYFSALLRYVTLSDNYQKQTVDIRNTINRQFKQYQIGLKQNVFEMADSCSNAGLYLLKLIEARNNKIIESMTHLKSLVDLGRTSEKESKDFYAERVKEINDSGCQILESYLNITATVIGFQFLKFLEKEILQAIHWENAGENYRFRKISLGLHWRYSKYSSIPLHNLMYISDNLRIIKKYKKDYLKSFPKRKK